MESEEFEPESILPRLYERDIDVVLQEELLFNIHVRQLFVDRLGIQGPVAVRRCELAVVDGTGETDILATLSCGEKVELLLIENKIDAAFQPRQPERYRERAGALVQRGECNHAHCVLIAPKDYAPDLGTQAALFDVRITYEDLALAIASEDSARSKHRAALIEKAYKAARAHYAMVVSDVATEVWQRIYRIANEAYPDLGMLPPGPKGTGGYWVPFKASLPKNVVIDWKITQSIVDLSFWAAAPHRPAPDIDLSDLGRPARLEQVGTMVVIRTPTLPISGHWTSVSDDQIKHALHAASDLHTFYRRRPELFV